MNPNQELEYFGKLILALEPWLDQVVIVGGWAHRLYRLDPRSQQVDYPSLTTLDIDVAMPPKVEMKGQSIRDRMVDAGFKEEFLGDAHPPATHYHFEAVEGGFYAEFLSPLTGSDIDRKGQPKLTADVGGISSQLLRFIDLLLVAPWMIQVDGTKGSGFAAKKSLQIANPAAFLAQKILISDQRDRRDRAKDILYIHDTIEIFGANIPVLQTEFRRLIRPKLSRNQLRAIQGAADTLFGDLNDDIREAAQLPIPRALTPGAIRETCKAGLQQVFGLTQ